MNSKKKKKKNEQDNKHCVTHMHENEKKKETEKIIIHRIIKMLTIMKTNDKDEDIFFLLIDFEYPSTKKYKK